jgi:peptide deformylase
MASTNVESVGEAEEIIEKLKKEIDKCEYGVGLAAIQIGIPKRVGVIKLSDKKDEENYEYLINATLKEAKEEFVYCREGCLSFPDNYIDTKRYRHFVIQNQRIRDGKLEEQTEYYYFSPDPKEVGNDGIVAIAVQHEMDHFDGICIFDRKVEPVLNKRQTPKIGRNDPCPCGSGKKFKKCCLGNGTYDS